MPRHSCVSVPDESSARAPFFVGRTRNYAKNSVELCAIGQLRIEWLPARRNRCAIALRLFAVAVDRLIRDAINGINFKPFCVLSWRARRLICSARSLRCPELLLQRFGLRGGNSPTEGADQRYGGSGASAELAGGINLSETEG